MHLAKLRTSALRSPKQQIEQARPAYPLPSTSQGSASSSGTPSRARSRWTREAVGSKNGTSHEIHVELDGKIRKAKPLAA
ncbi:hypothetical protein ACFZ8E_22965 [Methylobacterium sp. HMF5984]|uniref:hypothetical protein n=1 Tax=Methylobacterium sp. HMF5984 TaxID=3367370 RepID=UPI003854459E